MMEEPVPISKPIVGKAEKQAVLKVLDSGMLAQGPVVEKLEKEFAQYCGTKYAVAVNSGTAAIHTALFAAGVGPGDEVITTSFSFIATVNPILMLGATPVLVDIEPETFNIDVGLVKKAITPKTKAVIPVDLYGQPYEYDRLKKIAAQNNVKIIEDACQSVGAEYKGKKAGSLGDFGCFSLYATKNIMSGEGGIITTDNEKYAEAMKRFRQHGMSRVGSYSYEHLGYNYRMSDIHAAIAGEQLKKAEKFNSARKTNANLLTKSLSGITGIELPQIAPHRTHAFHQYTVRVTEKFPLSRDELAKAMLREGIITAVYYPKPLYTYRHIKESISGELYHPNAEKASQQALSLPVHPTVSREQITRMAKLINEIKA